MSKVGLDNKILKDMKEDLESKIDLAFKKSILDNKTVKVNLKITISTEVNRDGKKKPHIEYETGISIKENGFKDKGAVLKDLVADLDEEGNVLLEEENEQLELIEEEEE